MTNSPTTAKEIKQKRKCERKHKLEDYKIFEETAQLLNLSERELSEFLGYSNSTHHGWKTSGKMPLTAAKLCICYIEAQTKPEEKLAAKDLLLLIKVRGVSHEADLLKHLLSSLKINFTTL